MKSKNRPKIAGKLNMLVALGEDEAAPFTQADIKEMTGLTQSACQRCAAFLVECGLVRFEDDPDNGRKVRCRLTDKGRRAAKRVYQATIQEIDPLAGQPAGG